MKKKNLLILSLVFITNLCSCNNNSASVSIFGLQGNQDEDSVTKKDVSELETLLTNVSKITKYSYETTVNIVSNNSHFITYYYPNTYYELNDDESKSFGYGQEKDTNAVFKWYFNEDKTMVYPSIYEYMSLTGDLEKLTDLYGAFSIAHVSLLQDTLDTFSAEYVSGNKYVLTDSETASIFQYLTTFGSSITDYITSVYITILNAETNEFRCDIDLGSYGSITSEFKPLETSILDNVESEIVAGNIKGVDYYQDVSSFLEKTASNDYVIEGISVKEKEGSTKPTYRIHLQDKYFYLEYLSYDIYGNEIPNSSYNNYGFAYVKKGQEIQLYSLDSSTNTYVESEKIGPLSYDACFGFVKDQNDNFYFDFFKGPVESDSIKYQEVDALPSVGDSSILYIVYNQESGEKEVYEWIETDSTTGTYGFSKYSSWYDNVGDFAINDASATFYLGSNGLSSIGRNFFEKDNSNPNAYYSTDTDILSLLANSLFGWGFQGTTTWMSYVTQANLSVSKDINNEITKGEIGLGVKASIDGQESSVHDIYYTYDFSKSGKVDKVESFFETKGVTLA